MLAVAVWAIAIAAAPLPGHARSDPARECRAAAAQAARESGVPLAVLMAVSLTETGRSRDGKVVAWPWTLNIAGKGAWLPDRQSALALARATRAGGQDSFDVGCFQVNYRWHGHAFASLEAMIDPLTNARYAARFLRDLFRESGDWVEAAGYYHSRTPAHANRYRGIFRRHLAALERAPTVTQANSRTRSQMQPVMPVGGHLLRQNRFPLLRAGAPAASMGSLVPDHDAGATMLRAARPLWGG